jgi:hypothetical protein
MSKDLTKKALSNICDIYMFHFYNGIHELYKDPDIWRVVLIMFIIGMLTRKLCPRLVNV